jgi:hypothetical protein
LVNYYVLLRGWLFLSLPSNCLSLQTSLPFHDWLPIRGLKLSKHGSALGSEAYPLHPVSQYLRRPRIRNSKGGSEFYFEVTLIGVLQRRLPPLRLDCGPLLQEPAITRLDWSFAT